MDGSDLAVFAAGCNEDIALEDFPADFGRKDWACFTQQAYIKRYSNSGSSYLPASSRIFTVVALICPPRKTLGDYPGCGDDKILARVQGNSIFVAHMNATYNCCPDDID
ncbi:MAG: hypothetical protein U9N60_02600 [Thermodesulfobacteriota bacterium]|nr:hypothetical protein [Thermodesulfobacteriota bacterium]